MCQERPSSLPPKADCDPSLALRAEISHFFSSNRRRDPFLVAAYNVEVSPSYSSPRNFRGFNHLSLRLTGPHFSGAQATPALCRVLGTLSISLSLGMFM